MAVRRDRSSRSVPPRSPCATRRSANDRATASRSGKTMRSLRTPRTVGSASDTPGEESSPHSLSAAGPTQSTAPRASDVTARVARSVRRPATSCASTGSSSARFESSTYVRFHGNGAVVNRSSRSAYSMTGPSTVTKTSRPLSNRSRTSVPPT